MVQSDFFDMVYQVVRLIPEGRVSSYGAIGAYLGMPKSARMVGWAMNACHGLQPPVPAHRVVNSRGLLTGKAHFGNEHTMQQRLEAEGIKVIDDAVVDFDRLFWNPVKELAL